MKSLKTQFQTNFTLIELLVVISIIAILASLLMPALAQAKNAAKQIYCLNNLKSISVASFTYANSNDSYIPYGISVINNEKITWDDLLGVGGYDGRDMPEWLAKKNGIAKVKKEIIHASPLYICPADIRNTGIDLNRVRSYAGNAGSSNNASQGYLLLKKSDVNSGALGTRDEKDQKTGWSVNLSEVPDTGSLILYADYQQVQTNGNMQGKASNALTTIEKIESEFSKANGRHGVLTNNFAFLDGHGKLMKIYQTKSPNLWTRAEDD